MPAGTGPKPTSTAPPTAACVAQGHYLTTTPAGNALWSGGADGPEGSLLVLGVVLLLLVALLVIYGRQVLRRAGAPVAARGRLR